MEKRTIWNRDFVTICLSNFFLSMTFYILAVTLPIYVLDSLNGSKLQIGLVMTVFIFAAVIFRPLSGMWLDELKRKQILLTSFALYAACSLMYLSAGSFYYLLVIRFLHGIAFGIATTAAGTIVVDTIPEYRKGEGIGYYSLFMTIAMVIGPFLGITVMSYYNYTVLFIMCLIFGLLCLFLGVVTKVPENTPQKKEIKTWSWRRLVELRAIPISISGSIIAFSYGGITTFITSYAKELGMSHAASYFFVVFAAMIVLSRPFTGRVFDRLGEHILVYPGVGLFALGMLILSQATSPLLLLMTAGVLGLGYGALLPSFQAIAVKTSPKNRNGLAVATYFLLFDAGYGLGTSFLGIVASKTNYHIMYLVAGIIASITAAVYYVLHHKKFFVGKVLCKETSS